MQYFELEVKVFVNVKRLNYCAGVDTVELHTAIAGGETLTVEIKSNIDATELVEAVVCLANTDGGHLLVGVDEKTGEIVGAEPWPRMDLDPVRIEAHIAANTEPAVRVSVEVVDDGTSNVVVVAVPAANTVVATSKGKFVRRALDVRGKPQCLPMRPSEVLSRAGSTGERDFTRTPVPDLSIDDLDPLEIDRFRTLATSEHGDAVLASLNDDALLRALELVDVGGQLNLASVLLFGREAALRTQVPGAEVAFQHLGAQLTVLANDIGHAPLLRAMSELSERVQARNTEEEIDMGMFRVPVPRFAERAVRELIANALTHRDYTALGQTQVVLTDAGLEVSNPGGFPVGVTLANLLITPPRPRNPLLADAFKRAGLVERTSRGINLVFRGQLRSGHGPPDYSGTTSETVLVRVVAGPADREFAGYVEEARREGNELELDELLVLHEVRRERIVSARRVAELIQRDQAQARGLLTTLIEKGLIEPRGRGRGREYHLSASLYRRFHEAPRYVRMRGYDRLQQEQMILTYVRAHGSIARREAADLCQIDSSSAARVLREMRHARVLDLVGERRTARYVVPVSPNPLPGAEGPGAGDPIDALVGQFDVEPDENIDAVIYDYDR
ncbi:RNA-binding domain-containing protein [Candidatus Poriferisodalis sp.]|uniref:RNA-binding domain-containing protein n=1 Tax=Candidatus Poriferisodalis sp. TaxID=3101277 RepID=UPI003B020E1D